MVVREIYFVCIHLKCLILVGLFTIVNYLVIICMEHMAV